MDLSIDMIPEIILFKGKVKTIVVPLFGLSVREKLSC